MSNASNFKNNVITSISLDAARELAPAIFATSPAPTIKSPKYQFTPTFEVIEHMQDMGYALTGVRQSKSNVDLRKNWGIHITSLKTWVHLESVTLSLTSKR